MKRLLFLITLFTSTISFSQDKDCECLVKLYDAELIVHLVVRDIPKEYNPIRPKPGQNFAYNTIVKDSATFWFIKPQSRDSSTKLPIFKMKKLATTFLTEIQFNKKDSIPLYSEPDTKSKIVKYIHDKGQKHGHNGQKYDYNVNDYWFSACKNGFVKISSYEQGRLDGWVKKENYLHK